MKSPDTETVAEWTRLCLTRLRSYLDMKDDEDGKAPTDQAMEAAGWYITHGLALWPVPTMEGGIQLEGDRIKIEFGPTGAPDRVLLIGEAELSIYRSPPVCTCGLELATADGGDTWQPCRCGGRRGKEAEHVDQGS